MATGIIKMVYCKYSKIKTKFYCYLSMIVNSSTTITEQDLQKFRRLHRLSTIYYAYCGIHNYLREPFTSSPPLTLFNTSRYVANQITVDGGIPPKGISMLYV